MKRRATSDLHHQIHEALADTPKTTIQVCDWVAAKYGTRPSADKVSQLLSDDFKYGLVRRTMISQGQYRPTYRYYILAPITTPAPEIK